MFEGLMTKNGWEVDYQYDWVIKKQALRKPLPSEDVKEEEKENNNLKQKPKRTVSNSNLSLSKAELDAREKAGAPRYQEVAPQTNDGG